MISVIKRKFIRSPIALAPCIFLLMSNGNAQAEAIRIWIKAFIPNAHPTRPGYILPVPNAQGKTMIPGPDLPVLGHKCYNTNNRNFSSDPAAQAKITSEVSFEIEAASLKNVSVKPPVFHPTEEYDCQTGAITCNKTTAGDAVTTTSPILSGKTVTIKVDAAAHNPCVSVPGFLTPNIKYSGEIKIDSAIGKISFVGKIAEFPSYEAYFSVDNGKPEILFNEAPSAGAGAWSLIFTKNISASVNYKSAEGVWASTDASQRFKIKIDHGKCLWTEIGPETGRSLSRQQSCPNTAAGNFRLQRENDTEALQVLGMSPAIIAATQARAPSPSFIDFTLLDNSNMRGVWNGLVITKTPAGTLDEIRQPGTSPGKPYTFVKQ